MGDDVGDDDGSLLGTCVGDVVGSCVGEVLGSSVGLDVGGGFFSHIKLVEVPYPSTVDAQSDCMRQPRSENHI